MLPRSSRSSLGVQIAVLPQVRVLLYLVPILIVLLSSAIANGQSQPPERNFDRRVLTTDSAGPAQATATREQARALATLERALSGSLQSSLDRQTGVTRSLYNPAGYLTAADDRDPALIVADFLGGNRALLGLEAGDLDDYEVTDSVFSAVSGVTHIYLRQRHLDLPIYNAQLQVHVAQDGRISSINNAFVPGLAKLAKLAVPATSAADAVSSAAAHLGTPLGERPRLLEQPDGPGQRSRMSATALSSQPLEAELMWLPIGPDLQLVWRFQVHTPDSQHIYDMTVDAEVGPLDAADGGRIFTRFDWVASSEYRVYEQPVRSPNHTNPTPPSDARTLAINPEDLTASSLGWHDAGTTLMDGNNAHAYLDRNGDNRPDSSQPACSGTLECDFPLNLGADPVNSTAAAVANLFYWTNIIHDVQYQYGFDEPGGNFQESNFGLGGFGSDSVNAEAQDNAGGNSRCNANFGTPRDGGNPRMQMFVCNRTNPQRDGDFDSEIIVHEYGHGISIRQVGGPGNSSCLNNRQQAGEGWSDWFALVYTADLGDAGPDPRGMATYLFGQAPNGPGIRPQRYSTNPAVNNYSYASINGRSIPHGVGSVWAQAIWEVYWALVDSHGFDSDLYNALGGAGNQRALLYVNEGLKNTACSPTFLDARDGIIQAANGLFGGEDVCLLWESFAAYGLGVDAVSGGPNSTNPTNGFELPVACTAPPPPPVVTLSASDGTATEAGPTGGAFTVSRTGNISAALAVAYTVGGTATSGADYAALSGSVTIPAGAPNAVIPVNPVDDTTIEADETVVATLAASPAYQVGSPDSASVTITSDDVAPNLPVLTISAVRDTAAEAGLKRGRIRIERTGDTSAALRVRYTVGGSATPGADYRTLNGRKRIKAGKRRAFFDIVPLDDREVEGNETVNIVIAADPAYRVGSPASARVTVTSDDTGSSGPVVTITASRDTASEAGLRRGRLKIVRTGNTSGALTVRYNVAGSATAGADYRTLSGRKTIKAGKRRAFFDIVPLDDALVEPDETVRINLRSDPAYSVGTPGSGTVTVTSDERSLSQSNGGN